MATIFQSILGSLLKPVIKGMSKRRMGALEGNVQLQGIQDKVEIRRDPEGVPYLFAANRRDLFFAQGFVHAQDRLWQMEVNRRLALGRLSEVFGTGALDTDRLCRTMGFARMAAQDYHLVDADMQGLLQAYCDGVNAWIAKIGSRLPVEFKLAKFSPEPYEPLHVLAWTRVLTLQLSNGWGHELARAHFIEALGPEFAAELDMRHDPRNPATLPDGIEFNALHPDGRLAAMQGPFMRDIGGSNAWALSGNRTDTGKPYLCSDPHLVGLMPSIWYQIYMECPDFRVQGVSLPGMPLVMIGHNSHISWGITLAFSDIQDLFVEQFEPGDTHRYLHMGVWKQAEVHPETIRIKGKAEPHVEQVVVTHNGPVLSGVVDTGGQMLALNSPAVRPSALTMGWYKLDQARDWNGFVNAMRDIDAPGLNIVYADVAGNIGYWMTGKTPIRGKGQGELPSIGWTGEYDFKGYVPFEEMPHLFNPQRGYIVSANNKVVTDDYPHFMGNVWMNGYRARRIEELLLQKERWSRDEFPAIHMDVFCRPGLEFAAHYINVQMPTAALQAACDRLVAWDGALTIDTIGGCIYEVTRRELSRLLYHKAAGNNHHENWLIGRGMDPVIFKVSEFQGKDTTALLDLLNNDDSKLIALLGGKSAALQAALTAAVDFLQHRFGKDAQQWAWGKLHQIEFTHAMAIQPPMDLVFNAGRLPIPGDTDTVFQTSIRPDMPYAANLAIPSYRQIVDLADFDRSLWVKPPGQSGHLGSPNYEDQVLPWLEGRYFPMLWSRARIAQYAMKVQHLQPLPAAESKG
jgi:penicillin G amidase